MCCAPYRRTMFTKTSVLVIAILTFTKNSDADIELTNPGVPDEYRIMCYYGSWAALRTGPGRFTPEDIDPFLCTHLLYAFGQLTKDITFKPYNETFDIEQGGYARFTGLKRYNKNLKTNLSLGGWNEGSVKFASIAADPKKRNIFIKNCIEYLRKHNFDGLDLDWQFPNLKDRRSYSLLIKELREGFEIEAKARGVDRLRLGITLPTLVDHVTRGYDIPLITKYVDCMHALTYNYHTEYEPLVYHHSQLYGVDDVDHSDRGVNANYTMSCYLAAGGDRITLAMGIPTYGKVYNLSDPNLTEIGSPASGPGLKGDETNEIGTLSYSEICRRIKDDGWTVKQPYPNAMGKYAYKGNQWVAYDDENISRKKGEYVAQQGFGGLMFSLMEYDDFHGYCGGKPFPLIEAAKEGLFTIRRYVPEKVNDENDNNNNFIHGTMLLTERQESAMRFETMMPSTNNEQTTSESGKKSSIINNINPFPDFWGTTQEVSRFPNFSPTPFNENINADEVADSGMDDGTNFENSDIVNLLRNIIEGPGGIARLRKILNLEETTTSKSEPVRNYRESSLQQSALHAHTNDKQFKQTHKKESDPNLRDDVSQLFEAEEFKKSRILNVVFHINM